MRTTCSKIICSFAVLAILAGASAFLSSRACASTGLDSLAALVDTGELVRAEPLARRLLKAAESAPRPDSLEIAFVLDQLAVVLRRTGRERTREAEEVCERAMAIKKATFGEADASYAASLHALGALYFARMEYERSRPLLMRAYEIRSRRLGDDHPDVAWSLMNLGALESETGSDSVAAELIERAVAIQRQRPDTKDIDRVLGLNALATIRSRLGDYPGAVAGYEEALEILRRGGNRNEAQVGTVYHNLGVLQLDMSDLGAARASLERALKLRRKNLGKDHPMVAFTLMALAGVLKQEGDLAGAWDRYEDALRLFLAAYGPDNTEVGWARGRLGQVALLQGKRNEATTLLRESLVIQERVLGTEHPTLCPSVLGLADVAAASGDSEAAESLFGRCEAILEKAHGPLHPDLGDALQRHAAFLVAQGDTARALSQALRAASIAREHVRLAARGFGERQVLAYAARSVSALDLALSIVSGGSGGREKVARVWDELIRSRALVLDEVARRNRYGRMDSLPEWGRLRRSRQVLAALLVHGLGDDTPERYRGKTGVARAAVEQAERDLARASVSFGSALEQDHVGFKEVAEALPPGDVLVAYAVHGAGASRSYLAFLLDSTGVPAAVALGTASDVERRIRRWRNETVHMPHGSGAASSSEASCRTAGRDLRTTVWDSLELSIRHARRVFLVLDGDLHGVSLAALPRDGAGYLIEAGPTLHYLSAERDLAARPRSLRGRGLLAVGGVDFDRGLGGATVSPSPRLAGGASHGSTPSCDELALLSFPPLPESAAEAKAVAELWRPSTETVLLTGEGATEYEVTRLSAGKRVLHLATHGFALREQCGQMTAMVPGTRGIGGTVPSRRMRGSSRETVNPLRLSGLVLAGANQRRSRAPGEADGILTSEEVASLDLSGVEWAVLSACETGTGDFVAREGVLGLSRAFRAAQVGTLIVSLWQVEDPFARTWMTYLYEGRFREQLPTSDAVHRATLRVLRERRAQGRSTHPFHWSAFVATGDWK